MATAITDPSVAGNRTILSAVVSAMLIGETPRSVAVSWM